MAEVAPSKVPSRETLDEKFDEVFGADEEWGEGTPAPQEASAEEPEEVAEPDNQAGEAEVETASETEQVADQATEEVLEAAKLKPNKKDAQSRIQQLAAERKQLRDELARTQQYFNYQLEQVKAQAVEENRKFRESQEQQLDLQRRQFELMNADREAADFEKLPLDKKIELRSQRASEAKFKIDLDAREKKWQERVEKLEAARVSEKREAERAKRLGNLDYQAEQALDNVVLKGLDAAEAKQLRGPMKEMLMSWCGSFGEYPQEAAPRFAKYIDNLFAARLKTKRDPNLKRTGMPLAAKPAASVPGLKKPGQKRTTAEALRQGGLGAPLRDLADELFGRD